MKLYRPVGLQELRLIAETGFRAFPPRLPHQPIFYPVLKLEYARHIARDWNARDPASGLMGFVTEFEVSDGFASRYPIRTVGSHEHQELWVPAEELGEFCSNFVGPIRVLEGYPNNRGLRCTEPCDGDVTFIRANGDVSCPICTLPYRKHPYCANNPVSENMGGGYILHVLCDGLHVKL